MPSWSRIAVAFLASVTSLCCQNRPAAEILSEFDRLKFPNDSGGVAHEAFDKNVDKVVRRKGELALELFRQHPKHVRAAELLRERWKLMLVLLRQPALVLKEATVQSKLEGLRKDVRREALFACAQATLAAGKEPRACVAATERFLAVNGESPEGAFLIINLLRTRNLPIKTAERLFSLVEEGWPSDQGLIPGAAGYWEQLDRVGNTMPLEFVDLLSDDKVSTTDGSSPRTLCVYWAWQVPENAARISATVGKHADLRVLGIANFAMPNGPDAVRDALRQAKVDWPHCYGEYELKNPLQPRMQTPDTPFFYLLDERGKVLRFAYTWSVMAAILAEK